MSWRRRPLTDRPSRRKPVWRPRSGSDVATVGIGAALCVCVNRQKPRRRARPGRAARSPLRATAAAASGRARVGARQTAHHPGRWAKSERARLAVRLDPTLRRLARRSHAASAAPHQAGASLARVAHRTPVRVSTCISLLHARVGRGQSQGAARHAARMYVVTARTFVCC